VTADDILDLMPIVAHLPWSVSLHGGIRTATGQCPVCALVEELSGGEIAFNNIAITAMEDLFGKEYLMVHAMGVAKIMRAADDRNGTYRAALVAALDMPGGS